MASEEGEILNREMTKTVLPVTIFIGVETVVGILGNGLILYVYSRKYPHSNFRYFVLCMATIDFISCFTTLPGEIYNQVHWYDFPHAVICKMKTFFNVFTVLGSGLTLLLIAFDRHRKVCNPMAQQMHPSLALKLCTALIFISAIIASPTLVMWGKQTYVYNMTGTELVLPICEKEEDFKDTIYPFLYVIILYTTPVCLIILISILLNVLVTRKVFYKMRRNPEIPRRYVAQGRNDISVCTISKSSDQDQGSRSDVQPDSVTVTTEMNSYTDVSETEVDDGKATTDHRTTDAVIAAGKTPRKTDNHSAGKPQLSGAVLKDQTYARIRRKTKIMIVLTTVYVLTTALYLIMVSFVVGNHSYLQAQPPSKQVLYFFFWRLYFLNCVFNPLLYGVLDPRFRHGVKQMFTYSISVSKSLDPEVTPI